MSPRTLRSFSCLSIAFIGVTITGCSGEVAEEPLAVTAISEELDESLQSVSMSAEWLSGLNLNSGSVVLVPSDDAILALDADALADLASRDIRGWVLADEYSISSPLESAEDVATAFVETPVTNAGVEVPVVEEAGEVHLGGAPVTDVIAWDGSTLLVLGKVPEL